MKKLLPLLFISFLFNNISKASHLMGGEITWECLSNGKYVFTLKLYRNCAGIAISDSIINLTVDNHPLVSSIPVYFIAPSSQIINYCNKYPGLSTINYPVDCGTLGFGGYYPGGGASLLGAVEVLTYKSNPYLIPGIPGQNGWIFSWSDCCRSNSIVNIGNTNYFGMTYRAIMYKSINPDGSPKNMYPCFDSSPQFLEKPQAIINAGYPVRFSNAAMDKNLDSLVYSWDQPLNELLGGGNFTSTNPPPLNYDTGMAYNHPFPSPSASFPFNVAASIDSSTGNVDLTCFQIGGYVTVVKVTSYNLGQKNGEVYRDFPYLVSPALNNTPPNLTLPFAGGTSGDTTITAGSNITFNLFAGDSSVFPTQPPIAQSVAIYAAGEEFDTTNYLSSSIHCNRPPCAGLSTFPGTYNPSTNSLNFTWQTDCSLLMDSTENTAHERIFIFQFRALDDYCPRPASTLKTIKIKVKGISVIPPPSIKSSEVSTNGDVKLKWYIPLDTAGSFNSYWIYGSSNFGGPYTIIDSINSYTTDSIIIANTIANTNPVYFYMRSRSGCFGRVYSESSDTLSTFFVEARNIGNNLAEIKWNKSTLNPNATYLLFRKTNSLWTNIASTTTNQFIDSISVCNQVVQYKIVSSETNFNKSNSSIAFETMSVLIAIDSISGTSGILQNGFIMISVSGGNPPYQYSWSNNQTNQDIFNLGSGSYSISLSDNTGCIYKKNNLVVTNTIGLNELDNENFLSITPNPASDMFSIIALAEGELKISNTKGELVLISKIIKGKTNFSTERLANGSYTIQVDSCGKRKTLNLIVIH